MRLLVFTQIVDRTDTNLGFFHQWLEKLSLQVDHLYVICLKKGECVLPKNVTVLSLGKETHATRLQYLYALFSFLFRYRHAYDAVFVHMNPEYIILAGWYWRLVGKKVLLWYTHKSVNLRLRVATLFATKIFTASKESFRLKSKKVEVVGHGVLCEDFSTSHNLYGIMPLENTLSLLSVGRITQSKDYETVFRAIHELQKNITLPQVLFTIVGSTITESDTVYKKSLEVLGKELGIVNADTAEVDNQDAVGIRNPRQHHQMPEVYWEQHILIHTSRTGSMDKVVLEALAAGRVVVSSSEAFVGLANNELKGVLFPFPPGGYQELAKTIEKISQSGILQQLPLNKGIEYVRTHHNLNTVIKKIIAYFEA